MPRRSARSSRTTGFFLAFALAAAVASSPSLADGGPRAVAPDDPTAADLIRVLAPVAANGGIGPYRTRRVAVTQSGERLPIEVDRGRSVYLTVFFAGDTAVLTPVARSQLKALGEALSSTTLTPHRYLVAGHTDADGPALRNRDLSARRADAVRRYLVNTFGIRSDRLLVHGFGEQRPRASLARDPVNRRVEVALIVSAPAVADARRCDAPPGLCPAPFAAKQPVRTRTKL